MAGKTEQPGLESPAWALLVEISDILPDVSQRRMFGEAALFARDTIYALSWESGRRVGLKLPDPDHYNELMREPGAEPLRFDPQGKPVKHWVLLPPGLLEDRPRLETWVQRAHAGAITNPKRPKKKSVSKAGLRISGL